MDHFQLQVIFTQFFIMKYFAYCRRSLDAEDRQTMSIESQRSEIARLFGNNSDVEIVEWYHESRSAKSPGRPIFDEMVTRIERGHAAGIVTWAPDRLARNSIDGGRLIYLLDGGKLEDLKFATYTFENNSQGKFMLQIMFGQSKYYSDALSENVKRGNRTKLEKGWRPNIAPLGYLNDPVTKTIVVDPIHFPLVRRMYDLMLTGAYSSRQVARIARDEWGFRTPQRRKMGGKPLSVSSAHKILTNPFYAGVIAWGNDVYQGKHPPVVSLEEFENVGRMIRKPGKQRPHKHLFAFTGLIRCGKCNLRITAEHKRNRFGSKYIYYHCTKQHPTFECSERSIENKQLELQMIQFLSTLTIDSRIHDLLIEEIVSSSLQDDLVNSAVLKSLQKSHLDVSHQLDELLGLRLRKIISDAEFAIRRKSLQVEQLSLSQKIQSIKNDPKEIEPTTSVISFNKQALDWFRSGDPLVQRLIIDTVSSNLILKDKKLLIQAAKPFSHFKKNQPCPCRLAANDNIRTPARAAKILKSLKRSLDEDPRRDHILSNIEKINHRMSIVESQKVKDKGSEHEAA